MSIIAETAIREGQRMAESLMVDSCIIRRHTGEELNEESGKVEKTYATIYAGKCKVQARGTLSASPKEIGGAVITQTTRRVDIPVSAPEIEVDDLVKLVTSLDTQLVGKDLRVTSRFGKTYATARRLEVKEP